MKYQMKYSNVKELMFSAEADALPEAFLQKLEDFGFYGNSTRVDSPKITTGSAPLRISIYRPEALTTGIPVGFRLIFKRTPDGSYFKLVIIPTPEQQQMDVMPLTEIIRVIAEKISMCNSQLTAWLQVSGAERPIIDSNIPIELIDRSEERYDDYDPDLN